MQMGSLSTHSVYLVTHRLLQAQTAECLVVGEIAVGRMAVVLNKCDLVSRHVLRRT